MSAQVLKHMSERFKQGLVDSMQTRHSAPKTPRKNWVQTQRNEMIKQQLQLGKPVIYAELVLRGLLKERPADDLLDFRREGRAVPVAA